MNAPQETNRSFDSRKENAPVKHHSLFADDRHTITVKGVTDVVSFDENGVFLVTTNGQLNLEGTNLHVVTLNIDEGIVEVTGTLNGLLYYDVPSKNAETNRKKSKRVGRLFS